LRVEAIGIQNIDLSEAGKFYFFFDMDSEPFEAMQEYRSWCDILETEGGFIVKSHRSFSMQELNFLLQMARREFPRSDYQEKASANLVIRVSAKEGRDGYVVSAKPNLKHCPEPYSCPYDGRHNKEFIHRVYACSW
jgi:hypothetical protein